MVTQQIVAPPARSSIFMVLTVNEGAEARVREFLAGLSGVVRSVSFRVPEDELICVVGVGSQLWDRMVGGPRPAHLHPFEPVTGATHTAVATPGDLLFHLRSRQPGICFDLAERIGRDFEGLATVVDEVHGFKYFDDRDLLGFVDGTANPERQAAVEATAITEGDDRSFAGGSYVLVQKYLHDLRAWRELGVEKQETAIGRTKLEDAEFPDKDKASNAHITLATVVDEEGTEHDIVRDNMPFGRVGAQEFGTYFIGYARDPWVTEEMLRRMFIGVPEGNHDRILDFSTPVTGSLYFVPSIELLDSLDGLPAPASGAAPAAPAGSAPPG